MSDLPPPPPPSMPPPPGGMMPEQNSIPGVGPVEIATFGDRAIARVIDAILMIIVAFMVAVPTMGKAIREGDTSAKTPLATIILVLLISFAYEVGLTALRGQTLGKMIMKIKVVQAESGAVPGWNVAIKRWLPFLGLSLVGNLGGFASFVAFIGQVGIYASVLMDKSGRSQGVHDKFANDLVIKMR